MQIKAKRISKTPPMNNIASLKSPLIKDTNDIAKE